MHRYIAYLLILLLPLQAAAAARLAVCAESSISAVQTMDHCSQQSMNSSLSRDLSNSDYSDATKKQGNTACYLGSICIASFGALAIPSAYHFARIEHERPLHFFTPAFYLSVIPDTPQRPPSVL
jgi:hypothetical protein